MKTRTCIQCHKTFTPTHGNQKYCSTKCKKQQKQQQDHKNNHKRYIQNKKTQHSPQKCQYCGKTFTPTHGNQKYCSTKCRKNKKLEQNADSAMKYYHHNKKLRGGDKTWGIGSGGLSQHRNPDFKIEQQKIQNEKKRLHL